MKLFASILAFMLTAAAVDAAVINWTAVLAPENEVPPATSNGSGTGSGIIDTDTGNFTWSINWSDLSGQASGVHFHGPATTTQNAGIVVNVTAISGSNSPTAGSALLAAPQVAEVLAGFWYINVHTQANPGGEIRGQVMPDIAPVPVPATLPLLLGAGLLLGAFRRKTRRA